MNTSAVFLKHKKQKYPISKWSKTTGWMFVEETRICSYERALQHTAELQQNDLKFLYRIWDNRDAKVKDDVFKIGDWVRIGTERPFQIKDKKTAKVCTEKRYKPSFEAEQRIWDKYANKCARTVTIKFRRDHADFLKAFVKKNGMTISGYIRKTLIKALLKDGYIKKEDVLDLL